MLKKKFIVKAETDKIENFDPNLEIALNTIKYHIARQSDDFDFEIIMVFDGFVINDYFNDILNTFLHDIIEKNNYFNYVFKNDGFCDFVKKFIVNIFETTNMSKYDVYEMEGLVNVNGQGLSFKFFIPKNILSKEEYEDFLHLGLDWLVSRLNNNQIFDYFLAYMYAELAKDNLLKEKGYKDIAKYKMGLS